MPNTYNLAAYGAPTFWVVIDDQRIPVAVPDVDTAEKLLEQMSTLTQLSGRISKEAYDQSFEMLATMLSCNHNYIGFTADELKAKNITVSQIIGILTDWVKFILELAGEKNASCPTILEEINRTVGRTDTNAGPN